MSTQDLCSELLRHYNNRLRSSNDPNSSKQRSQLTKKHVVEFVLNWHTVDNEIMFQKDAVKDFLKVRYSTLQDSYA